MPFKNQQQVKACFAQYKRDIKANRIPVWDCYKWLDESPKNIKGSRMRSRSRSYKRLSPVKYKRERKVYIGPRGGKYVIVKGHKIYI